MFNEEKEQIPFKVWDRQVQVDNDGDYMCLQEHGTYRDTQLKIVVENASNVQEQSASVSIWNAADQAWKVVFSVLPANLGIAKLDDDLGVTPEAFVEEIAPLRQRLIGAVELLVCQ